MSDHPHHFDHHHPDGMMPPPPGMEGQELEGEPMGPPPFAPILGFILLALILIGGIVLCKRRMRANKIAKCRSERHGLADYTCDEMIDEGHRCFVRGWWCGLCKKRYTPCRAFKRCRECKHNFCHKCLGNFVENPAVVEMRPLIYGANPYA